MSDHSELVCAYLLDGRGGGGELDWVQVKEWTTDRGAVWLHFDAHHENTDVWLRGESGLSSYVVDALLATETRPRCEAYDEGILLILRGVNLNPGADPEDMVSIRIWIEEGRVISTRVRKLMAVQDVRDQLLAGKGPLSTAHLAARLAARLAERMGPVIDDLEDQVAELEEQLLNQAGAGETDLRSFRHKLVDLRQTSIAMRRFIAPQHVALTRLSQIEETWLEGRVRGRLREAADQAVRMTESLDELRERAAVVQDELMNRVSQRMEKTMYLLTLVATVMLPLGFLTGLLGINVGGIPGSETGWAFWAVCSALLVVVAVELWLLKRLRWL